ncbi:craniofacial development protein 2-like [Penaeus chinensis]|uniref:craniofacial development protein 2-like n=1 Tax=Penaeus chinensis TaxID=139456 RepID=UPI001FB72316|nr:craniofacial development protein 2-like [Penaeus chinensis]
MERYKVNILGMTGSSQAVVKVDCISDRLMVVRLCGTPVDLVVMVVYMPTSNHTDMEVEELYDKIEEKLSTCRGKDYVVVLGDMNATVGEEKILNVVGNYGLGTRNIRGEMLVDFCVRNKVSITNTLFKNNSRRYTWKALGDIRRLQLDYIIVRQRYKTSVKNSCSYPGADVDSDHNLVIMKVGLKLKKVAKAK